MQAALIIMTILGCDDTATQCHYLEQVDRNWASVQSCDADSEAQLKTFAGRNYPVIVAVCQTPDVAEAGGAEEGDTLVVDRQQIPDLKVATAEAEEDAEGGFTSRILSEAHAQVRQLLPERGTVRSLISKPVHVVTESYSWVAQRF